MHQCTSDVLIHLKKRILCYSESISPSSLTFLHSLTLYLFSLFLLTTTSLILLSKLNSLRVSLTVHQSDDDGGMCVECPSMVPVKVIVCMLMVMQLQLVLLQIQFNSLVELKLK